MADELLNPSEFSERVTIQVNTVTGDTQGGRSSSWGTLATVWAHVRAATTKEAITARSVTSERQYVVTVRYRTDVTAKNRVTWTPSWSSGTAAKTLQIHGVRPLRLSQTLQPVCGERV